jgi:uncharacterized membrane protein YqhA
MQQLMRTVGTVEAEWRQILQGSVGRGAKQMSQVLCAFGLLDFTMVGLFLLGRRFETYELFISLISQIFRAAVNRR